MSVFNAMVKMKNYIENCPTDDMKEAAKNDFIEAIKNTSLLDILGVDDTHCRSIFECCVG